MSIEMKEVADQINNLMVEVKKVATQADEKGERFGQDIEKLNKMTKDLEAKLVAGEAKLARAQVSKAESAGLELELKEINMMLSGKQKAPIECLDQYREAKSAVEKAIRKGALTLSYDEQKSINSVIDTDGGYFVMPTYSNQMIDKVFEGRQVIGSVNVETPSTGIFKEPVDGGDYDDGVYQSQRSDTPVDVSSNAFAVSTITAGDHFYPKVFMRSHLEDVGNDFQMKILNKIQAGMARQDAQGVITGLGNDTSPLRGLTTYANGTTWDKVERVTSATNDAFGWDDVLEKLPSKLFEDFWAGAKFFMQRSTFLSLLIAKDSEGRYQVGNQINFFDENLNLKLLKWPVLFDAGMPAVADGQLAVGFGDLEAGYTLVRRKGFSIHRDDSKNDRITLSGHSRIGGGLRNGQAIKLLVIQ
jgi:HK97 family phage major capsid protein